MSIKEPSEIIGTLTLAERKAECPEHGVFVSTRIVGFADVWTRCPICMEKAETERQETIQKEIEDKENQALISRIENANIPEKYKGATVHGWIATGDAMMEARAKCVAYVKSLPEKKSSTLILCGGVGTGKTHLAIAMLLAIIRSGKKGLYTSVMRMVRDVRSGYSRDSKYTEQDKIDYYSRIDMLVIDEIGVQFGTEAEKMLLFEILNGRYELDRPAVLLSNKSLEVVTDYLGEAVMDRFKENGGETIPFTWGSHRGGAR